jgi:hypothetical protein
MARNDISRREQAPAEASNDPVLIIDQCTAILAVALFISLLCGAASAAERGTAEQRRACTPDVFKHCSEFIPDAERITVCLREKVRELSPGCRVVMTGLKKAEATVGQAPRNAGRRE